jgi:hypothetical protein
MVRSLPKSGYTADVMCDEFKLGLCISNCFAHVFQVTKTEQPMAEYGSVQAWGSKKTNLNHLLNFHYEQRDLYNSCRWTGPALRTGDSGGKRHGYSRSSVPYNKERFLQAKYEAGVTARLKYTNSWNN